MYTGYLVQPPSASHAIRNGEMTPFGTWKVPRMANAPNGANYKTMALDLSLPELPSSNNVRLSMTTNNRSYTDYTAESASAAVANAATSLPFLRGSNPSLGLQKQRRGKYRTTHFPPRNSGGKVPSASGADSCWRVLGVRPGQGGVAAENIPRAKAYAGSIDDANKSLWPRLMSYHSPGVTTTSNMEYW
eukprot:gene19172-14934_t